MRWKLLIATSLLATVVGAGTALTTAHFLFGSANRATGLADPGWVGLLIVLLPLAAVTFGAIFVYRHTARRRGLQAAATALLAIILTLAALLFIPPFLRPRPVPPADMPPTLNT